MEHLTISVSIADRPYRLKIKKDEEERIRKAAKLINERIKEFSDSYAYNDKQDLLAMVCLLFANSSLSYQKELNVQDSDLSTKLKEIDEILSKTLD